MEEVDVKRLANDLLTYLRTELRNPSVHYQSPPTPLTGGHVTNLYKFQLKDAAKELSKPLVLRLYPTTFPIGQAYLEGIAQNAISHAGYPAPPVYVICTNPRILGGEFIIMACMPGNMMWYAYSMTMVPEMLAKAHVALHHIDPQPIIEELTEQGFFSRHEKGLYSEDVSSYIDLIETQITTHRVEWLKPSLQWIKEKRPPTLGKRAVCHMDFHPANILIKQGTISAVLDWTGFRIWEPETDVANTIITFTCVAPSMDRTIDWNHFINRYYECYLNGNPLDQARVAYYEALRCIRFILAFEVEGFEVFGRLGVQARLVQRFHELTGIKLKRPNE